MLVEGIPVIELPVVDGSAEAVWEWVSDERLSPYALEDVTFGALVIAKPGEVWLGAMTVSGTLAPRSRATEATLADPIPRFADTSRVRVVMYIEP
jgi:hypothetical protein